jgi:hypothetical protein
MWQRVVMKTATEFFKGPVVSISLNTESQPARHRYEKIEYRISLFIYEFMSLYIYIPVYVILVSP